MPITSDLKEKLTHKIGPLPAWGWAAAILGGYAVYRLFHSSGSTATSPGVEDLGAGGTGGIPPDGGTGGGSGGDGGGTGGDGGGSGGGTGGGGGGSGGNGGGGGSGGAGGGGGTGGGGGGGGGTEGTPTPVSGTPTPSVPDNPAVDAINALLGNATPSTTLPGQFTSIPIASGGQSDLSNYLFGGGDPTKYGGGSGQFGTAIDLINADLGNINDVTAVANAYYGGDLAKAREGIRNAQATQAANNAYAYNSVVGTPGAGSVGPSGEQLAPGIDVSTGQFVPLAQQNLGTDNAAFANLTPYQQAVQYQLQQGGQGAVNYQLAQQFVDGTITLAQTVPGGAAQAAQAAIAPVTQSISNNPTASVDSTTHIPASGVSAPVIAQGINETTGLNNAVNDPNAPWNPVLNPGGVKPTGSAPSSAVSTPKTPKAKLPKAIKNPIAVTPVTSSGGSVIDKVTPPAIAKTPKVNASNPAANLNKLLAGLKPKKS